MTDDNASSLAGAWKKVVSSPAYVHLSEEDQTAARAVFYVGAATFVDCLRVGHALAGLDAELQTFRAAMARGDALPATAAPGVLERAWRSYLKMVPAEVNANPARLEILHSTFYLGGWWFRALVSDESAQRLYDEAHAVLRSLSRTWFPVEEGPA